MYRWLALLMGMGWMIAGCGGETPPTGRDAGPGVDAGPGIIPTCDDEMRNGAETDVDCGGAMCDPCVAGHDCETGEDCSSGVCNVDNRCEPPGCDDHVINGLETGLDCGGIDCNPCDNGQACEVATDCMSMMCRDRVCHGPLCMNDRIDGNESDVDCGGGDCPPCGGGLMCNMINAEVDCLSTVCVDGICTEPTCDDLVKNRDEGDVDCGGAFCPACEIGRTCNRGSDCSTLSCSSVNNTCRPANCGDGIQNGAELGIDCGPVCPTQPVCSTCTDGVRNGFETDVDCGGSLCDKCDDGLRCRDEDDCVFGTCTHGYCGVGLTFAGFANWTQDCVEDSDAAQDAAMNAACAALYIGSRAATTSEMTSEGLVLGQPATNDTPRWIMGRCPGCVGAERAGSVDGHARNCSGAGSNFFDDWPTHNTCCTSTRSTVCIWDP